MFIRHHTTPLERTSIVSPIIDASDPYIALNVVSIVVDVMQYPLCLIRFPIEMP